MGQIWGALWKDNQTIGKKSRAGKWEGVVESNCFCPESLCCCIAINLLLIPVWTQKRIGQKELCAPSQTCAASSVSSKSLLWACAVSCNRRHCLDDVWCPFQLYDSGSKSQPWDEARGPRRLPGGKMLPPGTKLLHTSLEPEGLRRRKSLSCLSSILLGCLSFSLSPSGTRGLMRRRKRPQKDVPEQLASVQQSPQTVHPEQKAVLGHALPDGSLSKLLGRHLPGQVLRQGAVCPQSSGKGCLWGHPTEHQALWMLGETFYFFAPLSVDWCQEPTTNGCFTPSPSLSSASTLPTPQLQIHILLSSFSASEPMQVPYGTIWWIYLSVSNNQLCKMLH